MHSTYKSCVMSSDWAAFEIRGRYKESVAAEVLRDAVESVETNRTPLYLGLRAAVIDSSRLGYNQ